MLASGPAAWHLHASGGSVTAGSIGTYNVYQTGAQLAQPPGRTATQTIPARPLYDASAGVPVVSSPPPDLSGAVAFLSRPGASL